MRQSQAFPKTGRRVSVLFALLSVVQLPFTGCGLTRVPSASSDPVPVATACVGANAATQQVPLLLTSDANLGPLLAFELGINSIVLGDACGNSVTAYASPVEPYAGNTLDFELTHLNGVSEPITIATVPQATYTTATVTYSDIQLAYPYPNNKNYNDSDNDPSPIPVQASLAGPVTVDGNGLLLTLDTLITQPIVLGPLGIGLPIITTTPAFTLAATRPIAAPTNDRNGAARLQGLIQSAQAGHLTVTNSAGLPLPVDTSSATVLQGLTSLTDLPLNVPVQVDLAAQSDGTLLATRLELENPNALGAWNGPLVFTDPAGTYEGVVPRQWIQAANPLAVSNVYPSPFQFTPASVYQRTGAPYDVADLPFTPVFQSVADVAIGQGLSVTWVAMPTFGNQAQTAALSATLVPRTFSGTISSLTAAPNYTVYTLQLAANDFLATLIQASSITAYTNAGTQLEDGLLSVGQAVNMHGLVYLDGGVLRLVCDQVRLQRTP